MKKSGGFMTPQILLGLAFCLCIAAVFIYINRENNDFKTAMGLFTETKAKVDSSEARFDKLTEIVGTLSEAVKKFEEFDSTHFLEIEKKIVALKEEMKVLDVRMHGSDKRIMAATRNVNLSIAQPITFQILRRQPEPKVTGTNGSQSLLNRAGIQKKNNEKGLGARSGKGKEARP